MLLVVGFIAATVLGLMAVAKTANAQGCAPNPPDLTDWGCLNVTLAPAGVYGEFYVDTYLMAYDQYSALMVVLTGRRHIVVRPQGSTEAGYGQFFFYPESASTFATVNQGATTNVTVRLTRIYVNGAVKVLCDIRSAGDYGLLCSVAIDGIPQADLLAPGQTGTYYVAAGSHTFTTTLVGDNAPYWTPAQRNVTLTVSKGVTNKITSRFIMLGHLTATLQLDNAVADYYVNGQLIASQATGIDLWVDPNKYHKVEIKNIQDFNSAGQWYWQDWFLNVYVSSGFARNVHAIPTKVWTKGFLEVTCNITNNDPNQYMFCQPVLDGAVMAPLIDGQTETYTVDRGSHKVVVTVGPAEVWSDTARTFNVNVYGGRTSQLLLSVTAVPR